jgi:hypothetical protein
MRTKTLILTAALSAAGVATSMAQGAVYSVNAVGYVNTVLKPGYNLISNPLTAANNTIGELFKGLPFGTQVSKFNGTSFDTATYDDIDQVYLPSSAANLTVLPGEGVFVRNNTSTDATVTFVGDVPTGTLNNPLPKGLSIRSSMVPQAGTAADLGLVGAPGDQVNQFDPVSQTYYTSTFDYIDNTWLPALKPLKVGEAIFLLKQNAGTWTRTFNVNQ